MSPKKRHTIVQMMMKKRRREKTQLNRNEIGEGKREQNERYVQRTLD